MPKISVVMPVYNAEKYLREAVDSILAQTETDFELIVLDDGSTDSSREIILSYEDPRIRFYVNEKNLGVAATLNRGVELAQGEYIARMDADDISLPQRFAKQKAYLDAHPEIAVCGTWVERFGAAHGIHRFASDPEQMRVDMFFSNGLAHPSVMMRTSLFAEEGLRYDQNFSKMEDYALWLKVLEKHHILSLPEVLLRYRVHPSQVTQDYSETAAWQARTLMKKNVEALGVSAENDDFSVLVKNGKTALTAAEATLLVSYLNRLSKANRKTKRYCQKNLDRSVKSVVAAALSRFPGTEAAKIMNTAGGCGLTYYAKRLARGAVLQGKEKVETFLRKRKLKYRDFSIISNNCWGGQIYQKYGLPYLTPTAGLFILGEDFVRFCENLDHYLTQELRFIPWETAKWYPQLQQCKPYPVAMLDDVEVYFMHYASEEEAAEKWNRRKKRINKDKLILKLSQRENCSKETLERFLALPYKHKICFAYEEMPGTILIPELKDFNGDETPLVAEAFNELDYLNRL